MSNEEPQKISYCFNSRFSCMACCGIFNLDFSDEQRVQWLQQNTKDFLRLSLADKKSIHEYRLQKEKLIEKHRVKKDIYVCPFIGFIEESRGGCLLHPQGSPHPQIKLLQHPQNFSFYGESICQNYLCATAEYKMADDTFFTWLSQKFLQSDVSAKKKQAEEKSSAYLSTYLSTYLKKQNSVQNIFTASRFFPLAILWRILRLTRKKRKKESDKKEFYELYTQIEKNLQENNIPLTSFETWLPQDSSLQDNASAILTAVCKRENYIQEQLDWQDVSQGISQDVSQKTKVVFESFFTNG